MRWRTRRCAAMFTDPDDDVWSANVGRMGLGANMAFRAELLRMIGGFDPALGVGSPAHVGDDLAAFFEVLDRSHKVVYEPAAVVRHDHPETEEALARQVVGLAWQVVGYGAGLTAYLTKTLFDHPSRILQAAARMPRAMWHACSSRSDRNRGRAGDFPGRLRIRELAGMAIGPVGYWRSRRRVSRFVAGAHRDRAA